MQIRSNRFLARSTLVVKLLMVGACLGLARAPQAQNLPSGAQVAAGQVSITTQGAAMTVRNSPGAIVNWQSFNIGAGNRVYFDQASASSKVLNRVIGEQPSQIFGKLGSNGAVWLLNPNGVLFGPDARVDVGALVASTLQLSDSDFLAGRFRFTAVNGAAAGVRNDGSLNTSFGGQVVLLGSRVENGGSISAAGGQVALAAARSVELVDTALPHLSVRVDVPAGEVLNLGSLAAPGGRIDVLGAIVNQQGQVQASSLGRNAQGEVMLLASETLSLTGGSRTSTDAAPGATDAAGGRIELLGTQIAVLDGAKLSASGSADGGRIFVGGGERGQDAGLSNARAVYIGPEASLRADAGERGEGGRIVVWSDEATRAYGRFSARGGSQGGAGGFIETSGGWLDARPTALDVGAPAGKAGNWLLDPNDISIVSTGANQNITAGPVFTSTGDSSVVTTATLAAALNAGNSVTVTTANAGANSQTGTIAINGATLNVNPPSAVSLTLQAARDIRTTNTTIASTGAALSLDLVAAGSGSGTVRLGTTTISTNGGTVRLRGGGIALTGSTINGEAGISLQATPAASLPAGSGAPIQLSGSTLRATSASAAIRLEGADGGAAVGDGAVLSGTGINVADSQLLAPGSGSQIVINGQGASSGGTGVNITRSTLTATTIDGTGKAIASGNGFMAENLGDNTLTTLNATNLKLSGFSADPADSLTHVGVKLSTATVVNLSGRGAVDISGDYVLLGNQQASAPQLQMRGDAATLTLTSTASQSVRNATVDFSAGAGTTVLLLSDSDSVNGGRVRVDRATIRTGGGDFTITGGSGAAIGVNSFDAAGNSLPNNAVVGEGTIGAFFSGNAVVNAGVGKVSISGQLPQPPGTSQDITLSAIASVAATGTNNSITAGTIDIAARLRSAGVGFAVDSSASPATLDLTADRITLSSQGQGVITGTTTTVPAVYVNSASNWLARNGGTMSITASSGSLDISGVTLSAGVLNLTSAARMGGSGADATFNVSRALNFGFTNPAGTLIDDSANAALMAQGLSSVMQQVGAGVSTTLATAPGAELQVGAALSSPGLLKVQADKLTINAGGSLASTATGDALVITGVGGGPASVGSFTNSSGATALSVPNGRWVLQLASPKQSQLGGLQSDFTAYGLATQAWSTDASGKLLTPAAGNALGYAVAAVDAGSGPLSGLLTKIYDSTRSIGLDPLNWTISGLLGGDTLSFTGTNTALLPDKNVGTAKAVTLDPGSVFSVKDSAGKPVFGYAAPTFKADVRSAPLTVQNLLVPDKVYDGSAAASASGVLSGVKGADLVNLGLSASFADPAVGAAKPVTVQAAITGTDAANYQLLSASSVTSASITLPPRASTQDPLSSTSQTAIGSSLQTVAVPVAMSTPTSGRVLDVLSSMSTSDGANVEGAIEGMANTLAIGAGGAKESFKGLNFSRMPRDEIQTLLAARAGYKKQLFANSIASLAQDPTLADVRPCRSETELASGQCLLTEALRQEIQSAAAPGRRAGLRKLRRATLPGIERKLALLIGINEYADHQIPELAGAVPDARAVRDLLESQLGYEATLLENASRESIIRAFNRLALEAQAKDSVIIYYAGHGVLVPSPGSKLEAGYWLPADSDGNKPQTWLANADIARLVGLIGARQLMLISDSCYSGRLAGNERVQVDAKADASDLLSRRAAVVMASGGDEPVADEGKDGHSVFTWHLMKTLGELSEWQIGSSLFERVRANVVRELPQTPQYGAARTAGHQGNTDYLFERREFESPQP